MNALIKVVVAGNCQARPISELFEEVPGFIVSPPIVLHLSRPHDLKKHLVTFEWADFIFAQRTDARFPCSWLRTKELRKRYGKKVVVWPNIFFSGQQPYLRYLTHQNIGRILGPIEAMHDLRIFSEWVLGMREQEGCVSPFGADYVLKVAQLSLTNLLERENDCDIIISDVIRSEGARKLFFTFNHPTRFLLEKIFDRMLERTPVQVSDFNQRSDEPLGMYRVPSTWDSNGLDTVFQGREYILEDDRQISLGSTRSYTHSELRQAFFDCYNHYRCFEDTVTFRKDVAGWRLFRPPAERVTPPRLLCHPAVH